MRSRVHIQQLVLIGQREGGRWQKLQLTDPVTYCLRSTHPRSHQSLYVQSIIHFDLSDTEDLRIH